LDYSTKEKLRKGAEIIFSMFDNRISLPRYLSKSVYVAPNDHGPLPQLEAVCFSAGFHFCFGEIYSLNLILPQKILASHLGQKNNPLFKDYFFNSIFFVLFF
jgi:hypothetical protein